ncbi:MAG: O-antigen ligase family protein [Planctomycetota bacterium]|nr:O-antigen ligase family protein [Planctomycetota bacterium]
MAIWNRTTQRSGDELLIAMLGPRRSIRHLAEVLPDRPQESTIAFIFFILVNATLFLRPAEMFPDLATLPIYEVFILGAMALSGQGLQNQLTMASLKRHPLTMCVLGILGAIILSHVTHFYLSGIKNSGTEFLKVAIYYLLLIEVVDTPSRFRNFLIAVTTCAMIMVAMCVVDYLGWVDIEFLTHLEMRNGTVSQTGEIEWVWRMRGIGIFNDPNDISMVIVAVGVLSTYFMNDRRVGLMRFLWLLPIGMQVTALVCTRSRGGLLAMGAAGFALFLSRFGRKTALAFGVMAVLSVGVLAGRQGNIDLGGGTGQERVQKWRDGIVAIQSKDLIFGIGHGFYADVAGLVAHNSFVHTYVELGLFGGTLFFGCFFLPAWTLYRMSKAGVHVPDGEHDRFRPYLFAMLAGWSVGMMSLSRAYVVPTYMVIGIASAYLTICNRQFSPPRALMLWNRKLVYRLVGASLSFFAVIYVFVIVIAK